MKGHVSYAYAGEALPKECQFNQKYTSSCTAALGNRNKVETSRQSVFEFPKQQWLSVVFGYYVGVRRSIHHQLYVKKR
jgi:hypothetical protein